MEEIVRGLLSYMSTTQESCAPFQWKDAVERAIADAQQRYAGGDPFFGVSACDVNTAAIDAADLSQYTDLRKWNYVGGGVGTYTREKFCYIQPGSVRELKSFESFFQACVRGAPEANVKRAVMGAMGHANMSVYPFILSKTSQDMTWHVDGGERDATDVVLYFLLGPGTSTFYIIEADTPSVMRESVAKRLRRLDRAMIPVEKSSPCTGRQPEHVQIPLPVLQSWDLTASHAGDVSLEKAARCVKFTAQQGDVIMFDGSTLHAVDNHCVDGSPQLAIAFNFKGALSHFVHNLRPVRTYPTVTFKIDRELSK